MSITAADIQNVVFEHSKRGYDVDQVDEFLSRLELEVSNFIQQIDESQERIAQLQAQLEAAQAQAANAAAQHAEQPAPAKPDDSLERESQIISNAIISAQRSAEAIKREAREAGDKVYREAEAKSRDILRDALAEKQKTLEEVDRLKSSRERFRTDYLALLQKFVKQAEETFPDAFEDADAAPAPAPAQDPGATVAAQIPGTAQYGVTAPVTDADDDLD
ncbi:MAG: DivIVA domain-containing protein [Coriobacteriales bacterium]|nr:DivIVA domain-containing protein [Coriobacteriales bacterium]